jgi:two-component system NarL family sensor kinase
MTTPLRWTRALAAGCGTLAVLAGVVAAVLAGVLGWSLGQSLDAFVATNSAMGVTFAVCGAIIAWHRPGNPIGWLFVGAGLAHAATALGAPLSQVLYDNGAPIALQRLAITVAAYAWPWSIGLFLPLALLLFPDGRAPSPRWRPVVLAVVLTGPLFVLEMGSSPQPIDDSLPLTGYLTIASHDSLQLLWTVSEARVAVALALAVVGLVSRYRRADETGRRRLLWLVLATIALVVCVLPWSFIAGTPVVVLFAIPLVPIAVSVAIVRHQLLDIRLVVSRALAWLLVSIAVVVGYAALVALLDTFVSARLGRSAVATVVIVLLVAPLLPRLQRLVDRAMYGDRDDPASVVSRIGDELRAERADGLAGVVTAVRDALRMPYAAVRADDLLLAGDGIAPVVTATVPLEHAGAPVGELVVGLRPGEKNLSDADRTVLALVAVPLAVAVHAMNLSTELQASRERIVTAREEERRRLRRDLHDGLGPTLTGIALIADAAGNLLERDPPKAGELLTTLRSDTRTAIGDVRRIVENLRPPALDELGLVGALRERAEQLRWRADGQAIRVRLDLPDQVPALPAAVEAAGYRIVTEALNNVVRHSAASMAVMRMSCGETLDMEVVDDGAPDGAWRPGVGLQAMRERAAELGGRFEAGPSPVGGRVFVSLPLAAE